MIEIRFKELADSEKLMVRYFQQGAVEELIVAGKTYKNGELKIIE